MSTSSWGFASNPFDNVTRGSFKLMNILSADHDAKLEADAASTGIAAIYAEFHPHRIAYEQAYSAWHGSGGTYQGSTQLVYELLNQLAGHVIDDWDIRIQIVHRGYTPEYKRLLPDGRAPFQKGGVDQRIVEVKTLLDLLTGMPALAAVRTDISNFYNKINTARTTQQGNEGSTAKLSDKLEEQRILTAQAMYRSLARLMAHFWQKPWEVERYFDLENIRSTGRGKDGGDVPAATFPLSPAATVDSGLSFVPDSTFTVVNTGASTVQVCLSSLSGAACPEGQGLLLAPGEERALTPALLGKPEGGLLHFTNVSTGLNGSVEVWV